MHYDIKQFSEVLNTSKKILLINHIRMDGDAWWSLAALYLILKKLGKKVEAVNDCAVPPSFNFLGQTDIIKPELDIKKFKPDLIISLDASDTGRLGKIYENYQNIFNETPLVVIDHHISNPGFWDINIINPESTSTCELLIQVLEDLGLLQNVDSEIATFLYLGLQTDTNMYFNSNVNAHTLRTWAKLLELWADFRSIITEMFQKKSYKQLKLWEVLLENLQQSHNWKISYSSLSKYEIAKLDITHSEIWTYLKWAINELLINIEWTKVAFLIYPLGIEENKVSMRSEIWYDVAKICESFWGGWHTQAAWFQSIRIQDNIVEDLLQKIKEIL